VLHDTLKVELKICCEMEQILPSPSPATPSVEGSHDDGTPGREPNVKACNDVPVTISCGPGAADNGLKIFSPVKVLHDDVSNMPQSHVLSGASASFSKSTKEFFKH
jgi:hypothetical protein